MVCEGVCNLGGMSSVRRGVMSAVFTGHNSLMKEYSQTYIGILQLSHWIKSLRFRVVFHCLIKTRKFSCPMLFHKQLSL